MKFIAIAVVAMVFASCANKRNATKDKVNDTKVDKNETMPTTVDIIKVKGEVSDEIKLEKSDAFTIDAVEIRGNILYVDVTFSGGCEAHEFRVVASPFIAKSLPPIRAVQVIHNANGDACREVKKAKLEVYIDDFAYKQEAGSEIYLAIEGTKDKLLYTFQK